MKHIKCRLSIVGSYISLINGKRVYKLGNFSTFFYFTQVIITFAKISRDNLYLCIHCLINLNKSDTKSLNLYNFASRFVKVESHFSLCEYIRITMNFLEYIAGSAT